MPPRGSRKGAPGVVSEPSILNASSPKSRASKRKQIDESEQSPRRRSKRFRAKEEQTPSSPSGKPAINKAKKTENNEETIKVEEDFQVTTSHTLTKIEREVDLSVSGKVGRSSAKHGSLCADNDAAEVKKEEEDIEEKTTVTKKTSKKRQTKKEAEAEAMPLAARTQGLRMFVGAHVSAAKGVFNAVSNSTHIGGNAFALFLKSQRKWDNPPLQDDHRDEFRRLCEEQKYDAAKYVLPHGSYLVNLAQEDKAKAKQAYDSFLDDLRRCEALGIKLYNFHPGSANQTTLESALSRLAKALTNALTETSTVIPVLETMCGHGTTIGGSLSEFRDLLALIPQEHHSRIGICIDTCHSFAAGYDLASPSGFKAFLAEFEDLIGIKHLRALHLNDSKAPRGSKRDLHANIGTGFLGLRAFHNVMNEPRFEGLPMILETPIDRPASALQQTPSTESTGCRHDGEEADESDSDAVSQSQKKSANQKKKKSAKPALVADPSVWAREIKLLESLIGMDPEGAEFKALEAQLAEEGRESREKHQEQYDRKLEAEEKKKNKPPKGQKTLVEMMGKKKNG